jgi:hypothetical protein
VLIESVEAGGILRMGDREIVSMDDEQLGIGRIAEALSDALGLGERGQRKEKRRCEDAYESVHIFFRE